MTKREYAYVAIGAVIAIALIWWFSRPAAAAPPCVPAYTQSELGDVGGQLASATIFPFMLAMLIPAAASEEDITTDGQKLRGLCTIIAVGKHAAAGATTREAR